MLKKIKVNIFKVKMKLRKKNKKKSFRCQINLKIIQKLKFLNAKLF